MGNCIISRAQPNYFKGYAGAVDPDTIHDYFIGYIAANEHSPISGDGSYLVCFKSLQIAGPVSRGYYTYTRRYDSNYNVGEDWRKNPDNIRIYTFRYNTSGSATGTDHNMWFTNRQTDGATGSNATVPESGLYLCYAGFVYPNATKETNCHITFSNAPGYNCPTIRRNFSSNSGLADSMQLFGVATINEGSKFGIFGDGEYNTDASYGGGMLIRLSDA